MTSGTLKTYYWLTKPGIIYGNAIAATAGFFLASKGQVHPGLFLAMLAGLSLVIASGCVVNNYIDRDMDDHMARTRRRALVTGRVSGRSANIYATILGLAGVAILAAFTNLLTVGVALIGYFFYVVMYSLWWKRGSVHGTVVGSVSGAVPPVVGYTAVTGRLDTGAWLLFLILVFWQMPHFYSIAIFRLKDYAAAKVPVLPVKSGITVAKYYIVAYIAAFTVAASLLSVYGYTGMMYRIIALLLGIIWLVLAFKGFKATDDAAWARKLFRFSLLVLLLLSFTISIDTLLP